MNEENKSSFAPVPPPLLNANQIMKNGTAVPNRSGIYFIWEGPVVAYVGQTVNLARRLLSHPRLRRSDKISYLCIDSSELFYHEAFYIGICRPSRNGGSKRGLEKPRSYRKSGHTQIRVRKYSDGRWGFDDYSSGERRMVRVLSKEKAEERAADIALGLTNSHGKILPLQINELSEFRNGKKVSEKYHPNEVYRN